MGTRAQLLAVVLCVLVSVGTSIERESRGQSSQRFSERAQQCRLERLNTQQPNRRIESEAGVTEIWDAKEEKFQCAGVSALRNVLQPDSLALPRFNPAPQLVYIEQGEALMGLSLPGCPETFHSHQSSRRHPGHRGEREQGRRGEREQEGQGRRGEREQEGGRHLPMSQRDVDLHQKIHRVRRGDIVAIPAGFVHWWYNDGNEEFVDVIVSDLNSKTNQLDQTPRSFELAGVTPEGQKGERQEFQNILSAFDPELLAESFNIPEEIVQRIQRQDEQRGLIVRAENMRGVITPDESEEGEEEYRKSRRGRGSRFTPRRPSRWWEPRGQEEEEEEYPPWGERGSRPTRRPGQQPRGEEEEYQPRGSRGERGPRSTRRPGQQPGEEEEEEFRPRGPRGERGSRSSRRPGQQPGEEEEEEYPHRRRGSSPSRRPGQQREEEEEDFPQRGPRGERGSRPSRRPGHQPGEEEEEEFPHRRPRGERGSRPSRRPGQQPGEEEEEEFQPKGERGSRQSRRPGQQPGEEEEEESRPRGERKTRPSRRPGQQPGEEEEEELRPWEPRGERGTSPSRRPGQKPGSRQSQRHSQQPGSRGTGGSCHICCEGDEEKQDNGLEETVCAAKIRHNLNSRRDVDVYTHRAGRLNVVNEHKLPILKFLDMSAEKANIAPNAIYSPHWSINSHTVVYVTRGQADVQIVGPTGCGQTTTVMDERASAGDIYVVPQFFLSTCRAGRDGFEFVSFKTTSSPMKSPLAGYTSVFRAMPLQVLSNAYQISPSDAQELKHGREGQSFFLTPLRRSRRSS